MIVWFSPFELLFGRTVRGPMAILEELMVSTQVEPEIKSTYEYVLNFKDRLKDTCELAQQSLKESSERDIKRCRIGNPNLAS